MIRVIELPVLVSSGCHNKIAQTGWFKQQTFLSHRLETGSPRSRCWQDRFHSEACSFGFQETTWSRCVYMGFSWCVSRERGLSLPLVIRPLVLLNQDPTLMTPFHLNFLLKDLSPNSYIGGLGFQYMNFLRNTVQSIALSEFSTPPKAVIIKNKAIFMHVCAYGLNSPEYTSK